MQRRVVTPIVLEQDMRVISEHAAIAKTFAHTFHVDIIDGMYADNITVAPADLQGIDFSPLAVDIHLLVDDPVEWLPECAALSPARIFAQIEKMGSIEHYIEVLRGHGGVGIGLGVGIHTPLSELTKEILEKVDGIILMAIEAGFSGNPFLPAVLPRIKELRGRYAGPIVIDGGINPEHAKLCFEAGASEIGANSFMWNGNPEENYRRLLEVA